MTYLPKFINNQQAVRPFSYACNFVWIGPDQIPLRGICNLYAKAKSYTGIYGQFIPVLCLDDEAILQLDKSVVYMELININDCPGNYMHIKIGADKLSNCKFLLKIDLYEGQDIVYMPVIIIESLYEMIKSKLHNFDFHEEICNFNESCVDPEYFKEDAIFNYLITEVIDDLYNKKLYIQASDIIRLLILVVQPGCYVDIADIEMQRLPLNSDFRLKFMTHNLENYLIISLNPQIMINILCSMYINIRVNKTILVAPFMVNINTKINEIIVDFLEINPEELIIKGVIFDKKKYSKIDEYLYHHQKYQDFFVNFIAGFEEWTSVVNIIENFIKLRYKLSENELRVPIEVFPNPGCENQKTHFSYRDPFKSFRDRLLFLGEKINNINTKDYLLVTKEIDDIAKKYSIIDKYKIIMLAMISYFFKQEKYINFLNHKQNNQFVNQNDATKLSEENLKSFSEFKKLTSKIILEAKNKEQELYNLPTFKLSNALRF